MVVLAAGIRLDGPFGPATPTIAPSPTPVADENELAYDPRVDSVAALLAGMPLAGHALQLVQTADAYGIDWRLMPVISILESTGGAAACGGNAWGYARCQVRFAGFDEGMQAVAATLASRTYAGYDTATKFCIWVSGGGGQGAYAVGYARDAAVLYARLGGSMAVPAMPPESIELPPYAPETVAGAELPDGSVTATPAITPGSVTPTPTASPDGTPGEPSTTTATPTTPETPSSTPQPEPTPLPASPEADMTPALSATPGE